MHIQSRKYYTYEGLKRKRYKYNCCSLHVPGNFNFFRPSPSSASNSQSSSRNPKSPKSQAFASNPPKLPRQADDPPSMAGTDRLYPMIEPYDLEPPQFGAAAAGEARACDRLVRWDEEPEASPSPTAVIELPLFGLSYVEFALAVDWNRCLMNYF